MKKKMAKRTKSIAERESFVKSIVGVAAPH
jgi:hypothetical protein